MRGTAVRHNGAEKGVTVQQKRTEDGLCNENRANDYLTISLVTAKVEKETDS